jgi:hypothetical protein
VQAAGRLERGGLAVVDSGAGLDAPVVADAEELAVFGDERGSDLCCHQ